jgi:AP-3 complex subunit delta-1
MFIFQFANQDFGSASPYEVGIAISCLSNIATPDLCHDLVADVASKLGASWPYVRKKAVLCLYKVD